MPDLKLHVEICEDMWVPVPPSAEASLAGATVLANLSGSPITVARAEDRRLLVRSASARCNAAYVFAAAGQGESTTDLSWDGQTMVYESGELMAEGPRFPEGPVCTVADVDLGRLRQDRLRQGTHDDNRRTHDERVAAFRTIEFELDAPTGDVGLRRKVDRFPFVPDDPERLALDCYEAYNIQVSGLEQRLTAIGQPKAIIGVSGGLDSTHALIVTAKAMDRLGRPRSRHPRVHDAGVRDRRDHEVLRHPAGQVARRHLRGARHHRGRAADARPTSTTRSPTASRSTTSRSRTSRPACATTTCSGSPTTAAASCVGTGDLSELALGWCTYGVGDQMSHYNVNAGVPKTLVQHLIRWVAEQRPVRRRRPTSCSRRSLEQEITPELIPTREARSRRPPRTPSAPTRSRTSRSSACSAAATGRRKIAFLAWHAWHDESEGEWPPGFPEERRTSYDLATIRPWLEVFIKRFFASQFKRSALPNGPKVSAGGTMSPARRLADAVRRAPHRLAGRAGERAEVLTVFRRVTRKCCS